MFGNEPVADKALLKKVNQRLDRTGLGSRSRVTVTIRSGQVTLSGNIQYEHQRRPALKAVNAVEGVRGVMDHLQVQSRDAHRR
ncbi:MAG: BON domain-containing protein [Planctomycetota bacterium]|jgi:osmotically-inducible protein OsmY